MQKSQRFAVAHHPALFHSVQQVRDALDEVLPPAIRNTEPQPGLLPGEQGQFRFQLGKLPALPLFGCRERQLSQCIFLIGPQQLTGGGIRFRLIAPPFLSKKHFQAGSIAVFPGSTLLRKLCSPHHARDIVQLGFLRRLHRGRLRFALFVQHQKGTDVLTAGALAVFVIRAGTAGAHKAAVFPQPGLRMVAVSSAAAHIGRQMPHAVFAGLTVQVFHPVQIRLGPRKDGTAQQIADLFHVHARFLPLQRSIG